MEREGGQEGRDGEEGGRNTGGEKEQRQRRGRGGEGEGEGRKV